MINKIKSSLADNLEALKAPLTDFAWSQPEPYAVWLAQTFYYISHSTRLLALAGAHCPLNLNEFHQRFLDHAREEKGHDKLLINDMKSMGLAPKDFPELTSTATLYQTQYYWIQNGSPMAFFGYVLALEAIGAYYCPPMDQWVKPYHPKGNSFIRVHGEEDGDHIEKALDKIAKLPEEDMKKILFNMEQTFANYKGMLKDSMAYSANMKHKKAS